MGMVFGKTGVAEPAYEVLLQHSKDFSYEIRQYGERFAAQTMYQSDRDKPFERLARYIGVFGTPENIGRSTIAMTAPVVMQDNSNNNGGTKIAMTAPVVMQESTATTRNLDSVDGSFHVMQFILPAEYKTLNQIPKPTNPEVNLVEIPPAVGAVHRFSGSMDHDRAADMAQHLAKQLAQDGGLSDELTPEFALEHFQFWGFNPPFTLPPLRRNEVWLPLTAEQVQSLLHHQESGTTQYN